MELGRGCQPSVRQWVCLSSATPRGRPSEASETRARRPTWVPWHGARPRPPELCARTQVYRTDVKANGCAQQDTVAPHTPHTVRHTWASGASPSLSPSQMAGRLPPGGAQPPRAMEAVIQLMGRCFQNGLQVSLQKWKRKKKKKPIRLQSLFGECVSKGSLHAMETNP